MIWIKLTHTTGADYINLEQVYRIFQTSPTDLTFYDANSILPITYSFSTAQETIDVLDKLESLAQIIDIDKLADQG